MKCGAMLPFLLLLTGPNAQRPALDASLAFFAAARSEPAVDSSNAIVAKTSAGTISRDALVRYVAAHREPGRRRHLEDLAFLFVLARECEARRVAMSAPALAPAMAARRLLESDRNADAGGHLRARFATEALQQLRIDALVGAARQVDEHALRALFDHRYGGDGIRVRVQHILIGNPAGADASGPDAFARAKALRERLQSGESFEALLPESDDRTTRRLLRDPATKSTAGVVEGYNYQRFGEAFASAVRGLDVGAVSEPVASPVGWHLIQVLDRKVTAFEQVQGALQKELGGGKATKAEVDALRRTLLEKYAFRPADDVASQDPAPPSDWPHYRGNPELHGVAKGQLGDKPELSWTFATEGEILSSPVIADGRVYIGSTDNSVYAIELQTGEKRWSFATGDMVEAPPLALEGRVYVGSSDGFLYALDAASGELLWRFETKDKILGGANWFRAADGATRIVVGSYDASVYCLLAKDGTKLWSYATDNFVHGTPAIGEGEIVFGGCDAALHRVAAETGERIAKVELGAGCQVAGSVALAGNLAYFGHYGNEFLCVDLDSGATVWRYPGQREGFCSSPAIGSKHVVFGGRDRQLHCVLQKDGAPQWTFKTRRKIDGSPVICGDKVVFGSGDGRLYLLRLDDGAELWSYDIGKPVYSSPAVADGMIVVGASDKRIYAFRAVAGQEK